MADQGRARGARASVSLPVLAGGRVVGALSIYAADRRCLDDEVQNQLRAFAGAVGLALEGIDAVVGEGRLTRFWGRWAACLERLSRLAVAHEPPERVDAAAAEAAREALDVDAAVLARLEGAGRRLRVVAASGLDGHSVAEGRELPVRPGSGFDVPLRSGGTLVVDDLAELPGPDAIRDRLLELDMRGGAMAVIPGRDAPGGVLGVLSRQPRVFTADERALLSALANIVGEAIERARGENEARRRELFDAVTGLPRRSVLLDRVGQALERDRARRRRTALVALDLDGVRRAADSMGFAVGDDALRAACARLGGVLGHGATVARLAGYELALLLEDQASDAAALAVVERLVRALSRPVRVMAADVHVGARIGVALAGDTPDAVTLLRDASTVVHDQSAGAGEGYALFGREVRARLVGRLTLEAELREALDADQLVVHDQPIVDLRGGHAVAAEALVRWAHPEGGLLGPGAFVAAAEELGLIARIGRRVLDLVVRDGRRWRAEHRAVVPVSVNVASAQLARPEAFAALDQRLRAGGLGPGAIKLEITESALVEAGDPVRRLERLRRLECPLSLDDFGTGYSS